jgi:hypothetical protein
MIVGGRDGRYQKRGKGSKDLGQVERKKEEGRRKGQRRTKYIIQKSNFIPPIPMYTLLSLWEKETLSRVETSPNSP